MLMTDVETLEELPPVAAVTMKFLGPAAPHWEYQVSYGDETLVQEFFNRVAARLLLLPKHDPQFRRNRERVNRDAESERIICSWDLGEDDHETTVHNVPEPVAASEDTPAQETDESAEAATETDLETPEEAQETPADAVEEVAESSEEVVEDTVENSVEDETPESTEAS